MPFRPELLSVPHRRLDPRDGGGVATVRLHNDVHVPANWPSIVDLEAKVE